MRDTYILRSASETAALGRLLARAMAHAPFSLLMSGDLGCGKTTLTRSLVEALPGGEKAEISSPSFTLCNVYPTCPPVVHCDLYRQGAGCALPDEVLDMLADGAVLVCEWAEYLDARDMPEDCLILRIEFVPELGSEARRVSLEAHGINSLALATVLPGIWPEHTACEIGG